MNIGVELGIDHDPTQDELDELSEAFDDVRVEKAAEEGKWWVFLYYTAAAYDEDELSSTLTSILGLGGNWEIRQSWDDGV